VGHVVYASSSAQLSEWLDEFSDEPSAVNLLPIEDVVADIEVEGPIPELSEKVRELQRSFHSEK